MTESGFYKSSEAERQILPAERKSWPLWPWVALLAAVAVVVALRAGVTPPEARGQTHPAVGTKLTTFHLEPLTGEGRPTSEADLHGKLTLINFWGPWCPACLVEFPHMMELEKHFRSQPGFQFFSVSANSDPRDDRGLAESTEQFLKQQKAEFPTYRDPEGQTAISLIKAAKIEDFGFPATVLVGSDGAIRGIWLGYVPGDETTIRQAIEKALQQERRPS